MVSVIRAIPASALVSLCRVSILSLEAIALVKKKAMASVFFLIHWNNPIDQGFSNRFFTATYMELGVNILEMGANRIQRDVAV